MQDERESRIKVNQMSDSLITNAHKIAQESLASNRIKVAAQSEQTIIKTAEENVDKSSVDKIRLMPDQDPRDPLEFRSDDKLVDELTKATNQAIDSSIRQLNEKISSTWNGIKMLKRKGRQVVFKLDVGNIEDSYVLQKKGDSLEILRTDGFPVDTSSINLGIVLVNLLVVVNFFIYNIIILFKRGQNL